MLKQCSNTIIIIFVLSFIHFGSNCQVIKTVGKSIKIKQFIEDSTFTYDSRYVKYGVVNNIKTSKFPVEIRFFSFSMSSDIIDLKMIQSTKDSTIINTKKIWFASKAGIPNFKRVYEGENFTVNVASRPTKMVLNNFFDFYSELANNNFFSIQGVKDAKTFISNNDFTAEDGNSSIWIEIKVGKHIRNFSYTLSSSLTDPVCNRQEQMRKIINIINRNLTIKYNQ